VAKINYDSLSIDLCDGETVLEGLLRHDVDTPYSCQSGLCQVCMLRAETEEFPEGCQTPLKPSYREEGYFLPCICVPKKDLNILQGNINDHYHQTTVIDNHHYNHSICRIRFIKPDDFHYKPGQFINLRCLHDKSFVRSYSLSSNPEKDDFLEVQIRRKPSGNLSNWIFDNLIAFDNIEVQGPNGTCFYTSEPERNLLLVGTGTGIAPLYGIAIEALRQNHTGHISIYYGSRNSEGLYLLPELLSLADAYDNVVITTSLSGEGPDETSGDVTSTNNFSHTEKIRQGRANDIAFSEQTQLTDFDLYLCGNAGMVNAAQMQGFLAGVPMERIFTDPFEHKELRDVARLSS
jgi:ferredoxin-NADP reductase/ferredoxin